MKKILLIFFVTLFWWIPLNAQTQFLISDSLIYWKDTHVDGLIVSWDKVVAYLYKNQAFQDSTVLVKIDSGTFAGSHIPVSKGIYVIDYEAWLDDEFSKISEVISVIDPVDFKDGAGCIPPTGVHQATLLIADNEDTSAISQCLVQVWNKMGTQTEWYEWTVSSGIISFMFDTDTLMIKCYKPHYVFVVPESLFITADVTDTIFGTTSQIFPPAANLCRVFGYILDQTGQADTTILVKVQNVVYDTTGNETDLTVPLRYGRAIISPYIKYTTPNSDGYFSFDVYMSDSLTPNTTHYLLTAQNARGNQLLERAEGKTGILFQAPDTTEYWIEW